MVSVVSDDVARQRHLSTWNDLWHDILKYRQSAFRALFAKNDQLQESLNSIAPQRTRKQPKKTPLPLWKFAQARVLHAESCPWRRQRKERVQLSRSELYNNAMYVHLCTKRLAARVYEPRPQRRNEKDFHSSCGNLHNYAFPILWVLLAAENASRTCNSVVHNCTILRSCFSLKRTVNCKMSTDSTASQPTRKQTKKTPLHKDACNFLGVILIAENAGRSRCSKVCTAAMTFLKRILTVLWRNARPDIITSTHRCRLKAKRGLYSED